MFIKTFGSTVYGVEAITITIEVNWTAQGKDYCIVGLPDNSIKESMQRVESAIKSNGFEMPRTRIVVNLAPADLKKNHGVARSMQPFVEIRINRASMLWNISGGVVKKFINY